MTYDICPLCKQKGKMYEDQFDRKVICENQFCAIINFIDEKGVTAL